MIPHIFSISSTSKFIMICLLAQNCGCKYFEKSSSSDVTEFKEVKFDLNDISVLLPYPEKESDLDNYLGFEFKQGANQRILFKKPVFDQLISTVVRNEFKGIDLSSASLYQEYRIISMRADPCAPSDVEKDTSCKLEFRLVAQYFPPLFNDKEGDLGSRETSETAIHLIYRLDNDSFQSLIRDLLDFKVKSSVSTAGRLKVHPGIEAAGMNSVYSKSLKTIIANYGDNKNLYRAAILAQDQEKKKLVFGMIEKKLQDYEAIADPTSKKFASGFDGLNIVPESSSSENLQPFFKVFWPALGRFLIDEKLEDQRIMEESGFGILKNSFRIDNPLLANRNNTDCISCHNAGWQRLFVENNAPKTTRDEKEMYSNSKFDLKPGVGMRNFLATSTRHFGYTDHQPAITFRTINETAAAAQKINSEWLIQQPR
ncbi:MAG: hypothetical protein WCI18_15105 [Pseudomonadota bacterium]